MQRKWFLAKERGNGWGKPSTWEGWTVVALYAAFVMGAFVWVDAGQKYESNTLFAFLPVFIAATVLLLFVLFLTGEKPEWRLRPHKKKRK